MLPAELLFMESYLILMTGVLGAIIGSFLNVVIYRLHTGKSINGHSHCLSCQHRLVWFELLPLVSYIVLQGKCRRCKSHIPPRYFIVELVSALGFVAIFLQSTSILAMILTAILFALLVVIAVYDINHYVIPNDLVVYVCVMAVVLLGLDLYQSSSATELAIRLASGLGVAGFFALLWKVSNGRWIGFGDVKLALPLGALVGFPGAFSLVVLSFWIGATVSVGLILLQYVIKRGQIRLGFAATPLKMKSEVPFAPFLIIGFILSYFYGVDVLSLTAYVLST